MQELGKRKFIQESVEVYYEQIPALEKKPGLPNGFNWRGKGYRIVELVSEWHDYQRRGRMARNMRPTHTSTAERRGSWGVGQDYYRVRCDNGQVFDIYYDRTPGNADQRKGGWFLFQELASAEADDSDH